MLSAMRASPFQVVALGLLMVAAAAGNRSSWRTRAKERLDRWDYSNSKPLIGIMSQPCRNCPGNSYIPAAYVKWIESAGGRPVPIRYDDSDERLRMLFKAVNGMVWPGGLTWLYLDAPYVITARKLYNWAIEENENGDFFPIHGTCLGHQLLHVLLANASRDVVLTETDSVQNPNVLNFTKAAKDSLYFSTMDRTLMEHLSDPHFNIAYENHEMGVPPAHYRQWPELEEWYEVLTTTLDRGGQEYISTVEGKKYPFFGTQWHPEKAPYEFSDFHIKHSRDATLAANHLATMFVDVARLSSHKVDPELELDISLYNFQPTFTALDDVFEGSYDGPDMTYFLPESPDPATFPPTPPPGEDNGTNTKNNGGSATA